ncbi:MAG TPA: hypothetical protein VNN76_11205 [Bacteroidota bacterium]|nr:hypothetical protein [Bacteroidota bacterium]
MPDSLVHLLTNSGLAFQFLGCVVHALDGVRVRYSQLIPHDPPQQPVLHEVLKSSLADSVFTIGAEISRVYDVERHDGQMTSSAISRTL